MTPECLPQENSEPELSQDDLVKEARRLYVEVFKTLNTIPNFQEALLDRHSQTKPGQMFSESITFNHNGKTYSVDFSNSDFAPGTKELKIGEYEPDSPIPNIRLQIQLPRPGRQAKSSIIFFQLAVQSESLGSFPMVRDNQSTIKKAEEFLTSLAPKSSQR